jgi:hypothetical protein
MVDPHRWKLAARLESGENHPLAIAARPALARAGRAEEVREGMRRIYADANEDPEAFRVTSRYVVADIDRRP